MSAQSYWHAVLSVKLLIFAYVFLVLRFTYQTESEFVPQVRHVGTVVRSSLSRKGAANYGSKSRL